MILYMQLMTVKLLLHTDRAGNYVMIYHGNGLYTRYLHLDSLNVSVGQQVTKGQKLGVMGNTGNSFGAHLHFDVMLNGSYVNPMPYFK